MVVPHRDERPAGTRVLQVGVMQISPVDRPVIVDRRRNMEVLDLLTVRIPDDVAQASVVHALGAIFRIPDELVDKVAEVQNEAQPIRLGRALVLEDHPPVGVLGAVVGILTTDEGEFYGSRIVRRRRGDRSADAARHSSLVGEAIPVDAGRLEVSHEDPTGPVRRRGNDRG